MGFRPQARATADGGGCYERREKAAGDSASLASPGLVAPAKRLGQEVTMMPRREIGPEDEAALWRGAKRVEVERPARAMTSILSVRMPRDVFQTLSIVAHRQEKGPATLARELIEEGLAIQPGASRAIALSVFARILEELPDLQVAIEKPAIRWHTKNFLADISAGTALWDFPRHIEPLRFLTHTSTSSAGELVKQP